MQLGDLLDVMWSCSDTEAWAVTSAECQQAGWPGDRHFIACHVGPGPAGVPWFACTPVSFSRYVLCAAFGEVIPAFALFGLVTSFCEQYTTTAQVNVGYGSAKEARPSDIEDGLSGAVRSLFNSMLNTLC